MKATNSSSGLSHINSSLAISRRRFLAGTGTTALGLTLLKPELIRAAEANSKIDVGIIGCGGRGAWMAELFAKDGRYNVVAAADYFQDRVDAAGEKCNVPQGKRFTGLSGYKRLLEQKLDAVIIETPPYFHPEQAGAAVQAGKHVYCAKPVAVDVPGCQSIAESGKQASQNKLTFLVDFQTRAMPAYQEVVSRVHQGGLGQLVTVFAEYQCGLSFENQDADLRKDPHNSEVRLRNWGIDRALSGDVITEQNIHALDVATWLANANPLKAYGRGGRARPFLGDCWDHFSVLFFFPGDLMVSFMSKQVGFGYTDIMVRVHGTTGSAETHYGGKCWLKSRDDVFAGATDRIYLVGVQHNITTFYDCITKGDCSNPTVAPSVRSNLTTILGRMAAYQQTEVTWDEMMSANERLHFDGKGLKA